MLTVKAIADIIQTGMGLTDEQVWIYNQRREIPTTKGLFVVVGMMGVVPFGNNNRPVDIAQAGLDQLQTVHLQETLSINVFSRDSSAVSALPGLIASLNSIYSQQQQEALGFKIGTIPVSIADTSFLEGTSILYRFTVTIHVLRSYNSQSTADYYNNFQPPEILNEEGTP